MAKERSEIEKCKSLSYFVEKYVRVKNKKGERKFNDIELEIIKLIEKVEKSGGKLIHVWMRKAYKWILIEN